MAQSPSKTFKSVAWKTIPESRYFEMLGVLPPEYQAGNGFLVGEPSDHRFCTIEGEVMPRFAAFTRDDDENFYEAERPLTIAEFKASAMTRAVLA